MALLGEFDRPPIVLIHSEEGGGLMWQPDDWRSSLPQLGENRKLTKR